MAGATLRMIGGIHTLGGRPVEPRAIVRMNEAARILVSSRRSHWLGDSVGLACTTSPAEVAACPTVARSSRNGRAPCVLVFDGRIDNRQALIEELSGQGVDASSEDAGLILAAYRAWGDACPSRLIGDFAFGLWDDGARRLLCARDPLGVRPLYVLVRDDLVGFATQLGQLLAICPRTPPLDMEYVADRLALGVESSELRPDAVLRPVAARARSPTGSGERARSDRAVLGVVCSKRSCLP